MNLAKWTREGMRTDITGIFLLSTEISRCQFGGCNERTVESETRARDGKREPGGGNPDEKTEFDEEYPLVFSRRGKAICSSRPPSYIIINGPSARHLSPFPKLSLKIMAQFSPLLDAWQARQRPRSQHHHQQQQQQQFSQYDLSNVGIPALLPSPTSTSSPLSSSSSSAIPFASWTPSSWSEAEMLRRGLLSDRSVDMLSAFGSDHHPHHHQFNGDLTQLKHQHQHQQQLFDFNFSLPLNLGLSLDNIETASNGSQLYQQDQLRCSPPLLTPTSSYSSSSSACSPPTPTSPVYSHQFSHMQMFPSPSASAKRSIPDSESASPPPPSTHSVGSSDVSAENTECDKSCDNSSGVTNPQGLGPSATPGVKRQRACMSTKDFVPPDVTGLSKREARLVKNRAAAFLSRQRKREEFEQMEIRVAELEQENSRLRALSESVSSNSTSTTTSDSPTPLVKLSKQKSGEDANGVSFLHSQLAASRSREAELSQQLDALRGQYRQLERLEKFRQDPIKDEKRSNTGKISVKTEDSLEHDLSSGASSPASVPANLSDFSTQGMKNIISNPKSGASLGLMVLLCALPSLLSNATGTLSSASGTGLPTVQNTLLDNIQWDPPSFLSSSSSQLTSESENDKWEVEWQNPTGESMMDIDSTSTEARLSDSDSESGEETWKKLDIEGLGLGLGELEVSFSVKQISERRVKVRVASSTPAAAYESFSPSTSTQKQTNIIEDTHCGIGPLSLSTTEDPFLGTGPTSPLNLDFSSPMASWNSIGPVSTPMSMDFGSLGVPNGYNGKATEKESKRQEIRVRVRLSALPKAGGEGGEWEIELK